MQIQAIVRFVRAAAVLSFCVACSEAAYGQEPEPDSSLGVYDSQTAYEIAKSRLVRWAKANRSVVERELLVQIVELLEEAQTFANTGDYETAELFLDTADDLTRDAEQPVDEISNDIPTLITTQPSTSNSLRLESQVLSGVDYWEQEFELALLGASDTTYFENDGNPFVGLQMQGNYTAGGSGSGSFAITGKASRDYESAIGEIRHQQGNASGGSHLLFEDRAEWTRYRRDLALQFFENYGRLQLGLEALPKFQIYAGDALRVRRYDQTTSLFPSYLHNQIYGGLQYISGLSTRLTGKYERARRNYDGRRVTDSFGGFSTDYTEHRIETGIQQTTATNSSIALDAVFRDREYDGGGNDSTFQNPFTQQEVRADLQFGLSRQLSLDLQADFTLRRHRFTSLITPDFLDLNLNPQLRIALPRGWEFGVGYLYLRRLYDSDLFNARGTNINPGSVDLTAEQLGLQFEDYYAHGFSVSLELFRTSSFLLTLNNNFELRTYPGSPDGTANGLGLYTDRSINSIFLFLSWKALPSLDIGILLNHDQDKSREQEHSDSRNTLFSLDLGYRLF